MFVCHIMSDISPYTSYLEHAIVFYKIVIVFYKITTDVFSQSKDNSTLENTFYFIHCIDKTSVIENNRVESLYMY